MLEFFQSILKAFEKGFSFSWIANKSIPEVSLYIYTLLIPFVLITQSGICYVLYFYFFLTILLILKDNGFYKERHTFNVKSSFAILVTIQLLGHIFMILILFYTEMLQDMTVIIWVQLFTGISLYLAVLLISVLAILNVLFYVLLKFLFPSEINSSVQPHNIALKELSKYMTINDQIAYFIVAIFNVVMIGGTIIFGLENLSRYLDGRSVSESNGVSLFAFVNDDWFSLGTTIGILSVVIALLSATFPIQNKIYNSAHEKYKNASEKN